MFNTKKQTSAIKISISAGAGQAPGEIMRNDEGARYITRKAEIDEMLSVEAEIANHAITLARAAERLGTLAGALSAGRDRTASELREIAGQLAGTGDKAQALQALRHFVDAEHSIFRVMHCPRVPDPKFVVGPDHPAFPRAGVKGFASNWE